MEQAGKSEAAGTANAPIDLKRGDLIEADGKAWRVVAVGATEGCATYVRLASLTDGVRQKNGFRPIQLCGWLRDGALHEAP